MSKLFETNYRPLNQKSTIKLIKMDVILTLYDYQNRNNKKRTYCHGSFMSFNHYPWRFRPNNMTNGIQDSYRKARDLEFSLRHFN